MGVTGTTLRQLSAAASGFVTKNHKSYLAEALTCTIEYRNPVHALRLLRAMWGSYASSSDGKIALNDVGKWLEERLHREPHADTAVIALELGWLQRFAQIAQHAQSTRQGEQPQRRESRPTPAFGARIESIATRRSKPPKEITKPVRRDGISTPGPSPAPTELPAVFEAVFADFNDAREARKSARKRQQAGKTAKDRPIAVQPTDPALLPLAAGLVCSLLKTAGIDAAFEAAEHADGVEQPFYVTDIERRDGKRVVREVSPILPKKESQT